MKYLKPTVQPVKKNGSLKMTRLIISAFLIFTVNTGVNAQYTETFSTPNKGYLLNCINDFSGLNWSLSPWDAGGTCQVADPRDPTDYFNTTAAGVLECIDLDQEVYWESPLLNISAAGTVSLAVALSWATFDVDAAGNNCIGDFIRVQYSINGGAYTMVPNQVGGNPCATIAYPLGAPGAPFSGSFTVNQGGISGTTLKVRVVVYTNTNAEIVTIDNVTVPQVGVIINCAQPAVSTTLRNIVCNGASSGAILVTASGATPPYHVSWTGPSSGNPVGTEIAASGGTYTITGLVAGTYIITVTDAASCSRTTSETVISSPIVQSAITSPASCGQANGTIDLSVSGGNEPFTYLWSNNATTQDISGLTAGNYSVTITDASVPGCTSTATYSVGAAVNGPYNETFSVVNKGYLPNQVNNFFGVNWTMSPWTFNEPETGIGRGNDDYFQTNAAGKLEAVDTDMEVCWISPELNISASGTVNFSVALAWTGYDDEDYILVQYSINGAAFVTIPNQFGGGAGTIQYAFPAVDQNGSFTVTQAGITGNRLQIRICVLTNSQADVAIIDNVNIPQTVSLCLCPTITVTNPGVTTGTNGTTFTQTFTQSGGALPVTFSLNSGSLPNGLTLSAAGVLGGTPSAAAGSYPVTIKVTDANSCTGIGVTYNLVINCQTITVSNPAVTTGTNGSPFSQTFTQSGALSGATFTINTGTLPTGLSLSAAGVLSGTPTQNGTFPVTVKVTDGNACTGIGATYNLAIGAPAPVMSASLRDALLVDVNNNGQANPGDQLRYTNTIRNTGTVDGTGMNFNDTVPLNTVFNPGSRVTSALARDDNFTAYSNAPFTTANVITNDFGLPAVTVASFGTTVSLGTTTAAGGTGTTDQGGTLTVNANGTFSYTSPLNFTGTDQFMYIATTGVAGLPNNNAVVTITVLPDITFGTTKVDILCNGASTGSITFTGVSGGSGPVYTFSVNGAGGPFQAGNPYTGLVAGTYTPAVKDGAGYIKVSGSTVTITEPATAVSFTHVDVPNNCNGASTGSITITASGGTPGYTYSKNGAGGPFVAGNSFTGLAGGTYSISVKDANSCIVTQSVTLTDPPAITFTFTKTNISCFGAANGSIVFDPPSGGTGPYTYSITGTGGTFQASPNFTGLVPNIYTPVVKDAPGCNSATQSSAVTEPAQIVVNGTISNLVYNVAMTMATFNKTGGVGSPANPWSATGLPTGVSINSANGQVTGTPTQTGTFNAIITYTDANGCTGTKNVSFTVAPNLQNNTYANVVGNTQLVADGHSVPATPFTTSATNILTNDQADVAITVTAVTNAATTAGGSITIDAAGKFIYTPPVGSTAADSYVYIGTANGVSATATINFTIANMIWYVNNTYAGGSGASDGRSHRPFTTVNAAATASAINQIIYVHTGSGNTTGNALLKSGQTLRGAGSALTVGALSLAAGTKPTLSGMITLANSVAVDGFDMNTGATTAITSSGATTVAVSVGDITTSGAANAVTLTNTTGSVAIAGGTLTGGAGTVFNVSGGSATITCAAAINQATAGQRLVNIQSITGGTVTISGNLSSTGTSTGINVSSCTGGTITFSGTTKTLNTQGVTPVTLATNTGATINFSGGGLAITSTTATGFNATGGATAVNVTGTGNTITSTTGTALSIVNTTIGSSDISFQSISANGAVNGIVLNNTGSSGNLAVTGTGSAGSGGTIQNTTGAAIVYTSSNDLSIAWMAFSGIQDDGIAGTSAVNLTIANCTFNNMGNADEEDVLDFDQVTSQNLTGTLTVSNTSMTNYSEFGITVANNAGNLNVSITGCAFNNNNDTYGESAISLNAQGTAGFPGVVLTGNTFTDNEGSALAFASTGTGSCDIDILNNTITSQGGPDNFPTAPGFSINTQNNSTTFDIKGNNMQDLPGDGIVIVGEGTLMGRIGGDLVADGNTINITGVGDGVRLDFDGLLAGNDAIGYVWTVLIKNNAMNLNGTGDDGIQILNRDHIGTMNVTITNNTIAGSVSEGFRSFDADRNGAVQNGPVARYAIINNIFNSITAVETMYIVSDDLANVCTHISGNSGTGMGAGKNITLERRVAGCTLQITQASTAALTAANSGVAVNVNPLAVTTGGFCTTPPLPTN